MRLPFLSAALVCVLVLLSPPAAAQIDVSPRDDRRALGLNLAEVVGWSTQLPFIDVARNAVRWVGHTGSGWGGMEEADLREAGALDEDGWVVEFPRNL
ncbi:MAG: hypothetical protein ACK4GT_02445, partial [Pararhodobacter sp.]